MPKIGAFFKSKQRKPLSEREKALDPRFLLGLAICVAIAFLGINEIAYQGAHNAAQADFSQQDRRARLNALTQSLFNAQASLRGYLLSDDPSYLEQHRHATTKLRDSIERLELLASGDGEDREPALRLRDEVVYQLTEMDLALRLHQQNRNEALQFLMSNARSAEVQQTSATMSERLLQHQEQLANEARNTLQDFLRISRVGIALLTLAALLAFWLYLRQIRSRKAADMEVQKRLQRERDALERLVRQRTASLSELASYLQQVREHERSHLANELHDELGALLTAAKLDIARLRPRIDMKNEEISERVTHLTTTLNQVIALKRRIIEDLRPSSLNTLGLNAALENLTQEFTRHTGLPVESDLENLELNDQHLDLTIYRVVQEALTNITKYANATSVQTHVHRYPNHITVTVRDDGRGFDTNAVGTSTHGIRGMRHRIEALGGTLLVQSRQNEGTTVTATIPLSQDQRITDDTPTPPSSPTPPEGTP